MRLVVAAVTGALGLLLLGGPAFCAVTRLLGSDVVVAGGAVRLVFDLVVGGLLVRLSLSPNGSNDWFAVAEPSLVESVVVPAVVVVVWAGVGLHLFGPSRREGPQE